MQKREIIFAYLPNTSHFMHFQSVRQKKGNIHNKNNAYMSTSGNPNEGDLPHLIPPNEGGFA